MAARLFPAATDKAKALSLSCSRPINPPSPLTFAVGNVDMPKWLFLRRDGSVIAQLPVKDLREYSVGFERRNGLSDIAGLVIMNTDPQGLALDNFRFGHVLGIG